MERAARILSTIGLLFLLLELFSYLLLTVLYAIPGILSSYDESFVSVARTLSIVFGSLAGLSLFAFILCLIGRNKLFTLPGKGHVEHIVSGVLSLNVFLLLSGIFAWRGAQAAK